jgi:hypothetical protein
VAVADFNGDGKPDLVVANRVNVGTLSVLLGRGDGSFAAPVPYPVGGFPVAVAVGDFNGDGKPDLAVANWGSQDVNVLLGNGDGSFRPAVNYPVEGSAFDVVATDFNGDGKLDLVVAIAAENVVTLLRGTGDGTFQAGPSYATGLYPLGLAVGHLKGDARPDVVTANARSGNVSVLPNRPAAPFLTAGAVIEALDADGMRCTLDVRAYAPEDPVNDPDGRYRGTVRFHSSDPRAVLPGDYTFVPADNGSHAFRVTFRTPGSQTVTVTDDRGERLPASAAVWVCRPADLHFTIEAPQGVDAGKPFGVSVNVMDQFGQWRPGYAGTVRFRCTDAAAKLPADYTFSRLEGVHTFTSAFSLPTPGQWTITVTDTAVPGLTGSATVTARPASPGGGP